MPIHVGQSVKNQAQIATSGKQMQKVYVGENLVWQKTSESYFYYNLKVAQDLRNIAPLGWRIANFSDFSDLAATVNDGAFASGGGKLKEIGLTHWIAPNVGATDQYGFCGLGSGARYESGNFGGVGQVLQLLIYDEGDYDYSTLGINLLHLENVTDEINFRNTEHLNWGFSIRLVKEDNINTGSMIDNDGNVYPTVSIGSRVWMAKNLKSKKFRNNDEIPEITENAAWANLVTAGRCSVSLTN